MPRKVPKEVVKRMIASGRYTVTTLGGTKITDFKKLFDEAPPSEEELALAEENHSADESGRLPATGIVVPQVDPAAPKETLVPAEPAHEIINGKKYTLRQLEHFGDSVVGFAVRLMVYEKCGSDQRLYFHYAQHMITNKNLGHGVEQKGTEVEVELGRVFVEKGLQASLDHATALLKTTESWLKLVRLLETE